MRMTKYTKMRRYAMCVTTLFGKKTSWTRSPCMTQTQGITEGKVTKNAGEFKKIGFGPRQELDTIDTWLKANQETCLFCEESLLQPRHPLCSWSALHRQPTFFFLSSLDNAVGATIPKGANDKVGNILPNKIALVNRDFQITAEYAE